MLLQQSTMSAAADPVHAGHGLVAAAGCSELPASVAAAVELQIPTLVASCSSDAVAGECPARLLLLLLRHPRGVARCLALPMPRLQHLLLPGTPRAGFQQAAATPSPAATDRQAADAEVHCRQGQKHKRTGGHSCPGEVVCCARTTAEKFAFATEEQSAQVMSWFILRLHKRCRSALQHLQQVMCHT